MVRARDTYVALVDCNNFFVSCERLFRPDLRERPVVVLSSNDGCVISRSNEAKALGFKMGEPYFMVREKCTTYGVAVFSSNFPLYRDLSRRVMHTLRRLTDTVETYSIDEAFLLVPDSPTLNQEAVRLRTTVIAETGIPVSLGIARTKTLAKVATHLAKADAHGASGVCILTRDDDIAVALSRVPVGEVWGIGFRIAPTLRTSGVETAAQLAAMDDHIVRARMGVCGLRTVHELRGAVCFPVGTPTTLRKSLLHSESFGKPTYDRSTVEGAVVHHARKVAEVLRAEHAVARSISVFLRTSRHAQQSRHAVLDTEILPIHTNDTFTLVSLARTLARRMFRAGHRYAKAGVYVSDIIPEVQMPTRTLFGDDTAKRAPLLAVLDGIRYRFGDVVHMAAEHTHDAYEARHTLLSPHYTTVWHEIPTVPLWCDYKARASDASVA